MKACPLLHDCALQEREIGQLKRKLYGWKDRYKPTFECDRWENLEPPCEKYCGDCGPR